MKSAVRFNFAIVGKSVLPALSLLSWPELSLGPEPAGKVHGRPHPALGEVAPNSASMSLCLAGMLRRKEKP